MAGRSRLGRSGRGSFRRPGLGGPAGGAPGRGGTLGPGIGRPRRDAARPGCAVARDPGPGRVARRVRARAAGTCEVGATGKGFLITMPKTLERLTLVTNWFAELEGLVPVR